MKLSATLEKEDLTNFTLKTSHICRKAQSNTNEAVYTYECINKPNTENILQKYNNTNYYTFDYKIIAECPKALNANSRFMTNDGLYCCWYETENKIYIYDVLADESTNYGFNNLIEQIEKDSEFYSNKMNSLHEYYMPIYNNKNIICTKLQSSFIYNDEKYGQSAALLDASNTYIFNDVYQNTNTNDLVDIRLEYKSYYYIELETYENLNISLSNETNIGNDNCIKYLFKIADNKYVLYLKTNNTNPGNNILLKLNITNNIIADNIFLGYMRVI